MNWFGGNIAEAVTLSKSKNAVFVVFCEGTDEFSTALSAVVNDERIRQKLESDNFVAIKIKSDSEAYGQFAQIYKLVPVPSIFFIGQNGVPLEVVTGVTKTVDELNEKIEKVLKLFRSPSAAFIAGEQSPSPKVSENNKKDEETEVVCKDGVCYKQPKQKTSDETQPTTSTASNGEDSASDGSSSSVPSEEKLQKARDLIEKKRKEKEEEDARLAKERELQRRRLGQDLQNFKERQKETEIKRQQEERKRDKIEEQAARKRILEQIALDRAEREQKLGSPSTSSPSIQNENVEATPKPTVFDSNSARIQFKKPDGETEVQTFDSNETFVTIRTYVEENVIVASGIREFALAMTFPRKEFNADDNAKTLLELGLVPSAVILILPLDKATARKLPVQTSLGFVAMLTSVFWTVVTPVMSALLSAKNWIFTRQRSASGAAKRNSENELTPNDAAKKRVLKLDNPEANPQPSTSKSNQTYRRVGSSNIHRLNETKDSDDENNTWNGNSTQQQ